MSKSESYIVGRLDMVVEGEREGFNAYVDIVVRVRRDGGDVKATLAEVFATRVIATSLSSATMHCSAINVMLDAFGSRKALDVKVDGYNAKASHPTFNARTLRAKLVGGNTVSKRSAAAKRADIVKTAKTMSSAEVQKLIDALSKLV